MYNFLKLTKYFIQHFSILYRPKFLFEIIIIIKFIRNTYISRAKYEKKNIQFQNETNFI